MILIGTPSMITQVDHPSGVIHLGLDGRATNPVP